MRQSPRCSAADAIPVELSNSPTPAASLPATAEPPNGYRRLRLRIIGASGLLMHSGRLANPLDPIARQMRKVSGKRAKTEADFEQLAKLEFLGSLYLSGGEPCLPGEALEACLIGAAKKARRGAQARAGIICDGNFPLQYEGPREPEALWADEAFRLVAGVRVGNARVMRTRPYFRHWRANVVIDYLPDQFDGHDVVELVRVGGRIIGIGDWRPRFGRFEIEG